MTLFLFAAILPPAVANSPGADPPGVNYPLELKQQLESGLQSLGQDYQPRTRHFGDDGRPRYTNRLILEDSPYLLQHAHNPVDWYAWGEAAFRRAKRENKPIFLSIGYSTCHWCHVMERESFEDETVAEFLNTHFVAIKVDRERRPDIDALYMTAVQVISGRGGWPMSSFLTSHGKTFFAGTYFPRDQFLDLLQKAQTIWAADRPGLLAQAENISARVQQVLDRTQSAGDLADAAPPHAVAALFQSHDQVAGGFSSAPKFPNESNYLFLIDQARRKHDEALVELIRFDLRAMARGGIYDQVGGGFHRYSTDGDWLVPHFEKMLYNQAQLARAFTQGAALTGDSEFLRIAQQTLDYVLRDMQSPEGCFFSATDADSEGGEGRFFLWTEEQLGEVLTAEDARLAIEVFGTSTAGNFEGSNILHRKAPLTAYARPGPGEEALLDRIDRIRDALYTAREKRPHPLRDDKIITAWNSMMIVALTEAAVQFSVERYAAAAIRCGEFLWQNHRKDDGALWRASYMARTKVAAVQEDYAWLADACINLFDMTRDAAWLKRANGLLLSMHEKFWDETSGGYFMGVKGKELAGDIGRPKDITDGAVPAGNAVALHAMARLARRSARLPATAGNSVLDMTDRANRLLSAFGPAINRNPAAYPYMLLASSVLADDQSGPTQYAAHGGVAVTGRFQDDQVSVNIEVQPGWHINARNPLSDNLIPTLLDVTGPDDTWRLATVNYPEPVLKSLGFQSEPLALYEGDVNLQMTLESHPQTQSDALLRLSLQLQACNEEVCLPPEHLYLQIPTYPGAKR